MPIEEKGFCNIDRDYCRISHLSQSSSLLSGNKMTNLKMAENSNYLSNPLYRNNLTESILINSENTGNGGSSTTSGSSGNGIIGVNLIESNYSDLCGIGSNNYYDEFRVNDPSNVNQQRLMPFLRRANSVCSSSTSVNSNNEFISVLAHQQQQPTMIGGVGGGSQWTNNSQEESLLRDMCAQEAQKLGFIVGEELEIVKAKSHRSVIQNTPDRIINSFKDRYGQADSSSKKAYLQLGVRVPSKEHVSEIVGKQGSKIKQIREKTGALITTPGEQEDHVFIIEAPPRTALHVAQTLKTRADEITLSRSNQHHHHHHHHHHQQPQNHSIDGRRRSSCPNNGSNVLSSVPNVTTMPSNVCNNHNCNNGRNNGCSKSSLTPASSSTLSQSSLPSQQSVSINGPGNLNGSNVLNQINVSTNVSSLGSSSKIVLASGRIQVPKIIVGRIIGTQGSIITTIQRDTGTEIRSPPKESGRPKNALADFEILVYKTANLTDCQEASQRVFNAKQLIAHVAMHQLEKVRAEEAPYSNYQVQAPVTNENNGQNSFDLEDLVSRNKEYLLTEQMKPFEWIWPEVDKLDEAVAHEVVDRILEESKKKTKTKSETSIFEKEHCSNNSGNSIFPIIGENTDNYLETTIRPRFSLPENRGLGLSSITNSNGTLDSSPHFYSANLSRHHHPHPHAQQHQHHNQSQHPLSVQHQSSLVGCTPTDLELEMLHHEFQNHDFFDTSNNAMFTKSSVKDCIHHQHQQQQQQHQHQQMYAVAQQHQNQMFMDNNISNSCGAGPIMSEFPRTGPSERLFNMVANGNNNKQTNNNNNNYLMNSLDQQSSISLFTGPNNNNNNNNNNNTNYPPFGFDNSHWSFSYQTNNQSSSCSSASPASIGATSSGITTTTHVKSYAESLKLISTSQSTGNHSNSSNSYSCTDHGIIGDHLKKTFNNTGNNIFK